MGILYLLASGVIIATISLCKAASRADSFAENIKNREIEASLEKYMIEKKI